MRNGTVLDAAVSVAMWDFQLHSFPSCII